MFTSRFYTHTFLYRRHSGFSLLELIAVLIITSVLAITVLPRFTIADNNVLLAKQIVLDALRHSRESALSRAQDNSAIRFIASTTTVDVREGANSIQFPGAEYPVSLPSGTTIRSGSGLLIFDQLGNSSSTTIEVTDGDLIEMITLTGGGYAY